MSYIFPPIVDTYQKAFVIGVDDYMQIDYKEPPVQDSGFKVTAIEVSIRNQYNNALIIKGDQFYKYELGDTTEQFVWIDANELEVSLNEWYRVQLRFIGEKDERSEWSTVTLIQGISEPTLMLAPPFAESEGIVLENQTIVVQGSLSFANAQDTDRLDSYEIWLLAENKIIEKSGTLYPDSFNSNAIGPYLLKTNVQFTDQSYALRISYKTKSFYFGQATIPFQYKASQPQTLFGTFVIQANSNKGYNEIQLGLTEEDCQNNRKFEIQRSSYRNNYTSRETIFTIELDKYPEYPSASISSEEEYVFTQVFADVTAEPGVLYHYYLIDSNGKNYCFGENKVEGFECMLDTEHIFFTDTSSQFRLNLNPNISNFKYVVQESVTNTLGSAFPFVRRSGHTKYRQFSISGTICGYGDDEGIFLSKNSASLILSQDFYNRYKARNRIMPWNDYIFEKQYRDKAIEFLMDGKPKLFKSFTEGNMIVALTAVSFTPNKQLDRNIYDFSATVTEIAECTIENCQKYNCYENEAYKMYAPIEYYLVAVEVEIDGDQLAAIQENSPYMEYAGQGYLCVREVTSMLQASNLSSELDEILANDSVNRMEAQT